MAYAFTSVVNFYAKRAGINFYDGVQMNTWGSTSGEFSGYTCHPMWLSAACGKGLKPYHYGSLLTQRRIIKTILRKGVISVNALLFFVKWMRSEYYLRRQFVQTRNHYIPSEIAFIENILYPWR